MLFGGKGTIDVMKNLGLTEDEVIGHSMVTRSIRNAQDKIVNPEVSGRGRTIPPRRQKSGSPLI
ncbi:MAG TPA: hypothetical protein VIU13_17670 [Chryseolinea sp.]